MTQVAPPVHQTHLRDTQDAFDSVTADYDGSRGNNELIQDMRAEMWSWLDKTFAPNSRLIDLGCAIGMNKHTIWTRYYTPREFYRAFVAHRSTHGALAVAALDGRPLSDRDEEAVMTEEPRQPARPGPLSVNEARREHVPK